MGIIPNDRTRAASNATILLELIKTYQARPQKVFRFGHGTYYFNSIDFTQLDNNRAIEIYLKGVPQVEVDATNRNFYETKINTMQQDFMYDRRPNTAGATFWVQDMEFNSYDSILALQIPSGVCFGTERATGGYETNFHFNRVSIFGYDYGVKCPQYACGTSGGRTISLSCCHYGIYIGLASHLFNIENLNLGYNRVGVRLSHGSSQCKISNVHVATGYLGKDREDFDEYIVFHTKGNCLIDRVYYEDYERNALPERTIIFDYEGWAYGCGPLKITKTPIGKPGSKGGLWLRCRTYLGAGPEAGATNPTTIRLSDIGHYPRGAVIIEDCDGDYKFDPALFSFPNETEYKYLRGFNLNGKFLQQNGYIICPAEHAKVHFESAATSYSTTQTNTIIDGNNEYKTFNWHAYTDKYNNCVDFITFFERCDGRPNVVNIASTGNKCYDYLRLKGSIEFDTDISTQAYGVMGILECWWDSNSNPIYKFYPFKSFKNNVEALEKYFFDIQLDNFSSRNINNVHWYRLAVKKMNEDTNYWHYSNWSHTKLILDWEHYY